MKKVEIPNELSQMYLKLKQEKMNRYGKFHKGLFHIHTPASFDYQLRKSVERGKHYRDYISEEELFHECRELSIRFAQTFSSPDSLDVIPGFTDRLELLGYLCLVFTLENEKIEYVVVADHNTISGYKKLDAAIEFVYSGSPDTRPCVIAGVEISCADRNHVVVIFNKQDAESVKHIQNWLDENIMTVSAGSYRTSYDVLSEFCDDSVIAYIAHINSSNTFDRDFFSGGYKQKLFQTRDICLIGVSDMDKQQDTCRRVEEYAPHRSIVTFLDNDAHTLDQLSNNITYIKGVRLDFDAIRDAVNDFDTCMAFGIKSSPSCYVDGIIVHPGSKGFLCGSEAQPESPLVLSFSPSMNCLIGGRGTGKSTIINCFNVLLGGQYDGPDVFDAVCNHQGIAFIAYVDDIEYWIDYCHPKDEYGDSSATKVFQRSSRYHKEFRSTRGYYDSNRDLLKYLRHTHLTVYEVGMVGRKPIWKTVSNETKKKVLNRLFRRAYSINEIMTKVSSDRISEFIMSIICQDPDIEKLCQSRTINSKGGIQSALRYVSKVAEERAKKVSEIIDKFNTNSPNLRIVLLNAGNSRAYLQHLLPFLDQKDVYSLQGYNISKWAFGDYIAALIDKVGIVQVISMLSSKAYSDLINTESLVRYCEVKSIRSVEEGCTEIRYDNQVQALSDICAAMGWNKKSQEFLDCLNEYLKLQLLFDLEFDLSSSSGNVTAKSNFRSIKHLSLGQKVVAILTFILSFGKTTGDCTPLVIDQPEDNLDSQYIYSNLVNILRRVKDERQVIIATHNSTLVTNTKTEQVIVMMSDNTHGWVECTGYPTQPRIVKRILQYLEGGKPSFIHRQHVYHRELK